MAPRILISSSCCVCGKKKATHPGVRLHLFPKDVRRRMKWLKALNISYTSDSQAVCIDHFHPKWHASKNRLLNNAIPNCADGWDEQDINTYYKEWQLEIDAPKMKKRDVVSEELPFNCRFDDSFGKIDSSQDIAEAVMQTQSFTESMMHDVTWGEGYNIMDSQEPFTEASSIETSRVKENLLTYEDLVGDNNGNDPEDTEFSSDDDFAFWQKMEKRAKRRKKKPLRKKYFYKYSSNESGSRNTPMDSQKSSDQQSSSSPKEGNETSDKVSSVVEGSGNEDDWITDDEVDDEDHENIDMAFKREWEEKRLPPNSKEKNFVCNICGKAYSKACFLRNHVVRDHKEHEEAKRYPNFCHHCKKVYVRKADFMKHQEQFSGPCEICGMVLGCSDLFWSHRRDHDSVCKVCNKEFTTQSALYIHTKIKHSNNLLSCSVCDKQFYCDSLLKKHIETIHGSSSEHHITSCDKCGFSAKTHRALKIHRSMAHGSSGKFHITSCDKCDFSAKSNRALRIHQSMAHGSKFGLFTCGKCKKTFSTKLTYKNHLATHRKRGIVCPLCSKKFTSEIELQTHRISVHEVTDNVGSGGGTLSRHQNSSHLSQYACAFCNITFSSNEHMSQHMEKYHEMDIDSAREIRLEIERVHLSELDKNVKGMVQAVHNEETYHQESDKSTMRDLSTHFDSSSGTFSLFVPNSTMPSNMNVIEVNGVQYHVVRGSQQH